MKATLMTIGLFVLALSNSAWAQGAADRADRAAARLDAGLAKTEDRWNATRAPQTITRQEVVIEERTVVVPPKKRTDKQGFTTISESKPTVKRVPVRRVITRTEPAPMIISPR